MVAETAALSKGLQAFRAGEWALTGIFAEVVTQITALFENRTTARVATFEVKFNPHCVRVPYLDSLVP